MNYEFIVRFHVLSLNNETQKRNEVKRRKPTHDRDERVAYVLPMGLSFARKKIKLVRSRLGSCVRARFGPEFVILETAVWTETVVAAVAANFSPPGYIAVNANRPDTARIHYTRNRE